jgi:hypothetical protein
MEQVGARCYPGQHPDVDAALHDGVTRIESYVRQNSNPPVTDADIASFERQQGASETPAAQLCQGDAVEMYRGIAAQGADALRRSVDELVARPGPPTWGTCL